MTDNNWGGGGDGKGPSCLFALVILALMVLLVGAQVGLAVTPDETVEVRP